MLKFYSFTACTGGRVEEKVRQNKNKCSTGGRVKEKVRQNKNPTYCYVLYMDVRIYIYMSPIKNRQISFTQNTVEHTENTLDSQETKGGATY